jgi:protein SCO1
MLNGTRFYARSIFALAAILAGALWVAGCSSPKPAQPEQSSGPHKFSMHGRVVAIDKDKKQVTVDHDEIPGFMMAMTMGYSVKAPTMLDSLTPDDVITADVMVNGDDVWLENIVVVKKAPAAPPGKQ